MTRRLVIADAYDSGAFNHAAAAAAAGDDVDVLLLGLSPAWLRWQHPSRAAALGRCRILDPAPFADAAHALVRRFVVEFIAALPTLDLGGQTLERLLHEEEGNTWWYMETSEKGPYRGPLIGHLYALALARTVIDAGSYSRIQHSVRDPLVREALRTADASLPFEDVRGPAEPAPPRTLGDWPLLRYGVQAALCAGRLLAAWMLPRSDPRTIIPRGQRIVFTMFPVWWTNATAPDARERFFSATDGSPVAGYLAMATSPAALWRDRAAVRRTATTHRILFLQQFLSIRDGFTVLAPRRFHRLVSFQRTWRRKIRVRFAGFEVGPLVARDVTRSLSGGEPFQDFLLARAIRRAAACLAPSTILYRAEFQPTENALLRGSHGQATRIGFVHFPFGENYLPTRFAPGEISRYLGHPGDPDGRPMPDGFIASGTAIAEHITATGFPAARVTLCGPVRYESLVRYRRTQPSRSELRGRLNLPAAATVIFIALAIVEADTEALFGALIEAFGADAAGLHFVIRTHPNRPAGDPALATTLASLGADRVTRVPPGSAIYDAIAASDAMVCIGSMIAFEAMALGVMPIVFDNPATYGAVSLAEYHESLFVVRSGPELRAAIDHVVHDSDEARAKRHAWPRQLVRVLGDLQRSPGDQLVAALEDFTGPARVSSP